MRRRTLFLTAVLTLVAGCSSPATRPQVRQAPPPEVPFLSSPATMPTTPPHLDPTRPPPGPPLPSPVPIPADSYAPEPVRELAD
ncbi:MAG TPA: hypothetical protein VHF00_07105, partial [Acidimicrobiales bacterium]|nr:hypothetical protein [Acidimicrobiales bacterium]